jgi:hypothetical protein
MVLWYHYYEIREYENKYNTVVTFQTHGTECDDCQQLVSTLVVNIMYQNKLF